MHNQDGYISQKMFFAVQSGNCTETPGREENQHAALKKLVILHEG
jgi:hypothetical protein